MDTIKFVTITVEVLDILPGEPPRVLIGEWLHHNGNRVKLVQQSVPVRDPDVFARFTAQVCKGNTVQVTITTQWNEQGYNSHLTDFKSIHEPAPLNAEPMMAHSS